MKFRFNVSGPATHQSGGSAVVSLSKPPTFTEPEEELKLSPLRFWHPNQEPDTPLKCGCSIPWPVTVLLGSGGKVHCDLHGWQRVTEKDKQRARKASKQWQQDQSSSLLDLPPF